LQGAIEVQCTATLCCHTELSLLETAQLHTYITGEETTGCKASTCKVYRCSLFTALPFVHSKAVYIN